MKYIQCDYTTCLPSRDLFSLPKTVEKGVIGMDTGTKDSSDSDHTAEKRAGVLKEDLRRAVTKRMKLTVPCDHPM